MSKLEVESPHQEAEVAPPKQKSESERALFALRVIMGSGLLWIAVFALQASNRSQFVSSATVGILVAAASSLIGGLLGFLFGIPRTLQQEGSVQSPIESEFENQASTRTPRADYRANTNLEQISDWLTKILVGVGLTQIGIIPGKLVQISNAIASELGNVSGSRTFALAIILFFVICGFLFGYLWTRIYLPGAFRQADLNTLAMSVERATSQVKQVNRKLQEIEKQAELDARALSLAQRQLISNPDAPPVPEDQLIAAIKAASRPIKVQIFNQAQNQRATSWRDDKQLMELATPIFRALIDADSEGKYHRNHAQLGYALKDQRTPDWSAALAELNKAIQMRVPWKETGWLFYEFNRAVCNISLDPDYKGGRPSKPEIHDMILADLKAASHARLKKAMMSDPRIAEWMSLNGLTSADLPG